MVSGRFLGLLCISLAVIDLVGIDMIHLICSKEQPMAMEDRQKYYWSHPDATFLRPFFNLGLYQCPHCNLTFHCEMRQEDATKTDH